MAGFTYATFRDTLAKMMVITDQTQDPDFATIWPTAIEHAELRILRELDIQTFRKRTPLSGAGSYATVNGSQTVTLSPDFVVVRDIAYWTPATVNTTRVPLDRRAESFVRDYWPTPATVSGALKYYAMLDNVTLLIAPTPDNAYALEVDYTQRPPSLNTLAATPTAQTWLSQYLPDMLLYATLVWTSGFQRTYGQGSDDPQRAMSWEQLYQTAKSAALNETGRQKSQSYADVSATQPPPKRP